LHLASRSRARRDGTGLLRRPEVFPTLPVRIEGLRDHLVEVREERWIVAVIVTQQEVLVIAHRDPRVERNPIAIGCLAKTVEEDPFDVRVGAQEELPLRTATANQVGPSSDDLARNRHAAYIGTDGGELRSFRSAPIQKHQLR
jgi:hypothetical protein